MTRPSFFALAGMLLALGCGDEPSTGQNVDAGDDPHTGDGDGGGDGDADRRDAAVHEEDGGQDAGPPDCNGNEVRCNGECLAIGEQEGSCSLFAQLKTLGLGYTSMGDMVSDEHGELYVSTPLGDDMSEPTLLKFLPAGGSPTVLSTIDRFIDALLLGDTQLYFATSFERSDVRNRTTGSIGVVPRDGSSPAQVLVSDLANGAFRMTQTHFYMAASDLEPGMRRYDLQGKNEAVLHDGDVYDFEIVGDQMYMIVSSYGTKPVMKMPLAGGSAPTELGGGQCQAILGADQQYLYAHCTSSKRIALADGSATVIGKRPDGSLSQDLHGGYIYYTSGFSKRDIKLQRMSIVDGETEDLATLEVDVVIRATAFANDRMYIAVERAFTNRVPPFILKVDL